MSWLEANATIPRRDLHAAFVARFDRPEITADNIKALCTRKGWKTGRDGCFVKGQTPLNKGKLCPPGKGGRHPNARRTQFKPGERTGIAQKNYKPIGFERITEDGYRERKVNDDLPFNKRWRLVHLIEWEAVNGPIPKGHALKCLDGNKQNCSPSNWECIPRAMLPRLSGRWSLGYDQAPAELKPIVMANAKLKHATREKRRAAGKGDL